VEELQAGSSHMGEASNRFSRTARPASGGSSGPVNGEGISGLTATVGSDARARASSAGPRWTLSRAERRAQHGAASRQQRGQRAGGYGSEIVDAEEEERGSMFAYLAAVMQATDEAAGHQITGHVPDHLTVGGVSLPRPSRLHHRPRSARARARGQGVDDDESDGLLSYLTAVMAATDVTARDGPATSSSNDHTVRVQQMQLRQLDEMSANLVEDLTDQCAICFESQVVGQRCACLPCGHRFHTSCIRSWVVTSATCPLCKRNALHN